MASQGPSPPGDAPPPDPQADEPGPAQEPPNDDAPGDPRADPPSAHGRGAVPGVVPPPRPPDPIVPFLAPPVPRRRGRDWAILVFALVASSVIMAGCCVAGFALYNTYGG